MKKKKSLQLTKRNSIILIVISCLTLIILFIMLLLAFKKPIYQTVSRDKQIKEYNKNSSDGIKAVGWLRVQGTNIDYPVIYAPGVDFNNKVDDFVWTEADFKKLNSVVYISGHNIKNLSSTPLLNDNSLSRFEQLMSFVYYDFVKENQYIQYSIDGNDYLYKVYSVYFDNIFNLDLYNNSIYTVDEKKQIVDNSLEKSIYKFDIDINENDKIISLNTCTRMFDSKQLIVNARLVRSGEKISLSDVKKTNEYNNVDTILKGGVSDEA